MGQHNFLCSIDSHLQTLSVPKVGVDGVLSFILSQNPYRLLNTDKKFSPPFNSGRFLSELKEKDWDGIGTLVDVPLNQQYFSGTFLRCLSTQRLRGLGD